MMGQVSGSRRRNPEPRLICLSGQKRPTLSVPHQIARAFGCQISLRHNRDLLSGIKCAGSFKIRTQKYSACIILKIGIS